MRADRHIFLCSRSKLLEPSTYCETVNSEMSVLAEHVKMLESDGLALQGE